VKRSRNEKEAYLLPRQNRSAVVKLFTFALHGNQNAGNVLLSCEDVIQENKKQSSKHQAPD
jgi:hypothetical protein